MTEHKNTTTDVRVIASKNSWIEGEALQQLQSTAQFEGMQVAIGLPDLHPGKGAPIGAAFFTTNRIYPYIIGGDVGCGIGLWQTSLKANKIKRDRWSTKLCGLELPWEGDIQDWLQQSGLESTEHDAAHGTIGGGNHFAELQMIEKVYCTTTFHDLGLDKKNLYLLIHSGSRGLGETLLRQHTDQYQASGLDDNTEAALRYIQAHNTTTNWATSSRALLAHRFSRQLNTTCRPVLDVMHNSIEQVELNGQNGWLHRKGAAPSDKGPIVIPGSRGSLSYLVQPLTDQKENLWSLAHGAGRKWNRSNCKGRISGSVQQLQQTDLGSVVICNNKGLLIEDAPQAYKNIERVIGDMKDAGLIKVVATLRPLITYKTRETR
jgi:release factor H-coupled RctB family protein